jgi:hypothetical protein
LETTGRTPEYLQLLAQQAAQSQQVLARPAESSSDLDPVTPP